MKKDTMTNTAFVNGDGDIIPFGVFIEFETSEKSPYRKGHKDIGFVSTFENGDVGILDFLRAFECHKLRYMRLEDLELSSVKKIESVPIELLLPVIDWIHHLNGFMTFEEFNEKHPDYA